MSEPRCDLCAHNADLLLCNRHFDQFRVPDVFCTKDDEYPEQNVMVFWDDGSETFIGGYNHEKGYWFAQDDVPLYYGDETIYWCYKFDLILVYIFLKNIPPEDDKIEWDGLLEDHESPAWDDDPGLW